jgi:hypothetical protein
MHEWANEFNKANVSYSELGHLFRDEIGFDNGKESEKKNLLINGASDCETDLRISGLKIKSTIKHRRLSNSVVQPRPGSAIYEDIKNNH